MLRYRNRVKELRLYLQLKLIGYTLLLVWLVASLWMGLAQFLDENPGHILNLFKYWTPFRTHVDIVTHLVQGWRQA